MTEAQETATRQSFHIWRIVCTLAKRGLKHVVLCPGSRNTPLIQAFEAHDAFEVYSIIDERSAGFFALGQARTTHLPSIVVTTSGSALGNLMPAVMEASATQTPLLIISADRPIDLIDVGANQTTRQPGIFAERADVIDLHLDGPNLSLSNQLSTFFTRTNQVKHVNIRLRKPFELDPAVTRTTPQPANIIQTEESLPLSPLPLLKTARSEHQKGFLICGTSILMAPSTQITLQELARELRLQIYADPTSPMRASCDLGIDPFLMRAPEALKNAFVLQVGDFPTSGRYLRSLERANASLFVVHPFEAVAQRAPLDTWFAMHVDTFCKSLAADVFEIRDTAPIDQNAAFLRARIDQHLRSSSFDEVVAAVQSATLASKFDVFFIGNSLAIRHLDRFSGSIACPQIHSQRGLSGIDGLIAGAAGAASLEQNTIALIGDVSACHDLGSLLTLRHCRHAFALVILNNDGGRIFEELPVADQSDLNHFRTARQISFEHAATHAGIDYHAPANRKEFQQAVLKTLERGKPALIEVASPHSPKHHLDTLQALAEGLR